MMIPWGKSYANELDNLVWLEACPDALRRAPLSRRVLLGRLG